MVVRKYTEHRPQVFHVLHVLHASIIVAKAREGVGSVESCQDLAKRRLHRSMTTAWKSGGSYPGMQENETRKSWVAVLLARRGRCAPTPGLAGVTWLMPCSRCATCIIALGARHLISGEWALKQNSAWA